MHTARLLASVMAASLGIAAFATITPARGTAPAASPDAGQEAKPATIRVEPQESSQELSPAMQGVNMIYLDNADGLWDATADAPNAAAVAKISQAGIGLLRFPGGSRANLYDWKRSIGPADRRLCQTNGVSLLGRMERTYGQDEFMQLVRAVGAEPEIAVPFPNASPGDVADWFEYLNAPVGTNPNGGVAWAEMRAVNGSPEPYGATRWEVGNEPYLAQQAFWMDQTDEDHRLGQFIEGDEINFVDQPLGRQCDFDAPTVTTRTPGQRWFFLDRLIKDGTTPVVKVGGVPWTEIDDFAHAGPTDNVYVLDRPTGSLAFGDGTHGAIPPRGQTVTATYTFRHEGFVAIYDALKSTAAQIGLDIDVCASWAPLDPRGTPIDALGTPSFAQEMSSRGLGDRYDCVAAHPYTSLGTDFWPWETAEDALHAHMVGDDWAYTMMSALDADVKANSTNNATIAITEMGALWFATGPGRDESVAHMPQFSSTMTHATYMASQWLRYAPMGVAWIQANDLAPNGLRGVLGDEQTGFVYSAEAMTREALKPFFATGGHWVPSHVKDVKTLAAPDGSIWQTFLAGAAVGADGVLYIVAVNRDPESTQEAHLVPAGFPHDSVIQVATVRGASFISFNDDGTFGGDNTVTLTRTTLEAGGNGSFRYDFPPSSVTVLTLSPG